jgi:hypothetical protein
MYRSDPSGRLHAAGEALVARYIKDLLSSSSRVDVLPVESAAPTFADAFRRARAASADYFVLLSDKETERDIQITAELRVARTGSPASSFNAYRTGNDRVKNAAARIADLLVASLQPKGSILKRSQDRIFADLGKTDGVANGDKLLVLKNGTLAVKAEGLGHSYAPASVLGEVDVTKAGEESCEGTLKNAGFFDTINVGDELILNPPAATTAAAAPGATVPGATAGTPAAPEFPSLFSAVQRLR